MVISNHFLYVKVCEIIIQLKQAFIHGCLGYQAYGMRPESSEYNWWGSLSEIRANTEIFLYEHGGFDKHFKGTWWDG